MQTALLGHLTRRTRRERSRISRIGHPAEDDGRNDVAPVAILLWTSHRWRTWEKVLGTLVVPGGPFICQRPGEGRGGPITSVSGRRYNPRGCVRRSDTAPRCRAPGSWTSSRRLHRPMTTWPVSSRSSRLAAITSSRTLRRRAGRTCATHNTGQWNTFWWFEAQPRPHISSTCNSGTSEGEKGGAWKNPSRLSTRTARCCHAVSRSLTAGFEVNPAVTSMFSARERWPA